MKQLVDDGWFGEVVNVNMTLQTKASSEKASKKDWEEEKHRKTTLLMIVGGHTLYYLTYVLGSISEISAQLSTRIKHFTLKDTGEQIENTIVDQIHVHGLLKNETPFSSQLTAVPHHSKGWRMEINGTEGTVVATSSIMPQITPIELKGAKGDSEMEVMEVPSELVKFDHLPEGPPGNVGRNYGSLVDAIWAGQQFHPNFDDALFMHRLIKTLEQSSLEKRTIETLYNDV